MKKWILIIILAFCLDAVAEEADLLLKNGTIITMEDSVPEASSVAVKGDKIVWIGNTSEASRWTAKNTRVIDLEGAFVYPGFIESHAHIVGLGQSRSILPLVGTKDKETILRMVADRANTTEKGSWILGRGWDQNDWPVKEFPTAADLDSVSSGHPVVLERIDGHAIWVNSQVLKIAGITSATKDPDGGKILRNAQGNPSGILTDAAATLVERVTPAPSQGDLARYTKVALEEAASKGITMIQDAGTSGEAMQVFKQLASSNELPVRIYSMVSYGTRFAETFLNQGPANYGPFLDVRSMKMYMDGALGSRGAALLEPYSDDPNNTGSIIIKTDPLMNALQKAKKAGIQVGIHAIGDRANRMVLDAYEKVGEQGLRWRIEHVQVLAPSDIPRLQKLDVIASMQPTHATSDGPWATDRLGPERVKGAYAWRSLLDLKTIIAGGSDAPVEDINPLWGIYAAITRQDHQGKPPGGWHPEQLVTPKEALHMFTVDGAYAAFKEKELGSIKVGKLADLVVLPENILTCVPSKLIDMKVLYTITDGKVRYQLK
ncbi:MAG TPA: amidohydrolase [Acidobacteriota bacterium]|nr:amidohydrolase [Acidobacteriota bacterium]